MKKISIKNLVNLSYTKESLDSQKVQLIASKLTRKQLKAYVHSLKNVENKKQVLVTTAFELSSAEKKAFGTLYKNKTLEFLTDPSIITGARIIDSDVIFEESLQKTLQDLLTSVSQYE